MHPIGAALNLVRSQIVFTGLVILIRNLIFNNALLQLQSYFLEMTKPTDKFLTNSLIVLDD
jgi:hypothetical protein